MVAAAVLAEVLITPYIRIGSARPDVALICVAFFGMFLGPAAGLETGIAAGLFRDIFTLDIFWINAFIFGLAGYAAGAMSSKFYRESRSTQVFMVFGLTVVSMCLHCLMAHALIRSPHLDFGAFLLLSAVPSGLYTAIFAVPLFVRLAKAFDLGDYRESY